MRSGRVKKRARPLEKVWTRIFREAGARVRENVFLRDTTVSGIPLADERRIEIVASGLPLLHGLPVAVDGSCFGFFHEMGTVLVSEALVKAPDVIFCALFENDGPRA